MKVSAWFGGLAAALVGVSAISSAQAAPPKYILQEPARAVAGGRSVQVLVAQSELKSDINKSYVAVAAGGGLLMALIDAKIEADRAKRAEAAIQPVRTALTGYDVDALAVETTKTALPKVTWFEAPPANFGRDTSVVGKSATLDASAASQVAFLDYAYDLTPDFSGMRVGVTMTFANKAAIEGKKPEARLDLKNLGYYQTVLAVVQLPTPSKELSENAARWSASDGKLARQALAIAFEDVGAMIPQALQLSEADAKAMKADQKAKQKAAKAAGGGSGPAAGAREVTLLPLGGLSSTRTLVE